MEKNGKIVCVKDKVFMCGTIVVMSKVVLHDLINAMNLQLSDLQAREEWIIKTLWS